MAYEDSSLGEWNPVLVKDIEENDAAVRKGTITVFYCSEEKDLSHWAVVVQYAPIGKFEFEVFTFQANGQGEIIRLKHAYPRHVERAIFNDFGDIATSPKQLVDFAKGISRAENNFTSFEWCRKFCKQFFNKDDNHNWERDNYKRVPFDDELVLLDVKNSHPNVADGFSADYPDTEGLPLVIATFGRQKLTDVIENDTNLYDMNVYLFTRPLEDTFPFRAPRLHHWVILAEYCIPEPYNIPRLFTFEATMGGKGEVVAYRSLSLPRLRRNLTCESQFSVQISPEELLNIAKKNSFVGKKYNLFKCNCQNFANQLRLDLLDHKMNS